MIHEEDIPRINKMILELNEVAKKRKEVVDKLWMITHHGFTEQIQSCTDELWILEVEGETLRLELMKLLDSGIKDSRRNGA